MGEDVIARESNDLPVCIVRPSMIVPAWKDPMPVSDTQGFLSQFLYI